VVVGSVEIEPVADAVGLLCDYVEAYPGVPLADWEPYRELYPTLFAGDAWRLPCVSYLIRSEGVTILVDTALLDRPEWVFAFDELEPTATRAQLIEEIVDNEGLVVCGHYPGSGIGRVVTRDGRVLWDEAR
jgi:hypothetical protein